MSAKKLPGTFDYIKVPSWMLAIGLFISLVAIGYVFQQNNPFYKPVVDTDNPLDLLASPTPSTALLENAGALLNWNNALILSKPYGDMTIGAFWTEDLLGGTYIVAPIVDGVPITYGGGYALAFMDLAMLNEKLFDVVGDKIYIINQEHTFIDVYTASLTEKFESVPQLYRMNYLYSLTPPYDVGWPASIECTANLCSIVSAFGHESRCDMQLNVTTKQYFNAHCASFDQGEYTPKLR